MGSCCCKTDDSHRIDEGLGTDKAADREIKKLLLLGAGSSGKSTFFKQLKCIHGNGFSSKDRRDYAAQIENQVISQMQKLILRGRELIEECEEGKYDHLEIKSQAAKDSADFMEILGTQQVDENVAENIATLWKDPGIQNTWKLRGLISVPDSSQYFFDRVHRIAADNYKPTDEDILLVRKRTTGIIEEHFVIRNTKFHIFDVGGQRNERKKWMHCFERVTAVIFVASLSSYNEVLLEDETVIVMNEEINLFENICNSRWFTDTAFILFLNKRDLFEQKFKTNQIPLRKCFPDFHSDQNEFTCATDKDNVTNLFNDVQQVVIQSSLKVGGLI